MSEYYGVNPSSDFFAHYGVKGMKWGVRKALEKGGSSGARALARQYKKASKKLRKLEKHGANGKKYAKRAAALGVGAAAAGGLAAVGTKGVSSAIGAAGKAFSTGAAGAGSLISRAGGAMTRHGIRGGGKVQAVGTAISGLSKHNASGIAGSVQTWGEGHSIGNKIFGTYAKDIRYQMAHPDASVRFDQVNSGVKKLTGTSINQAAVKAKNISNSGYARIGAAGIGAGLAAGAGYNAYRAATAKRSAKKAANFKKEMKSVFAGTQYANLPPYARKKRRG